MLLACLRYVLSTIESRAAVPERGTHLGKYSIGLSSRLGFSTRQLELGGSKAEAHGDGHVV